MNKKSLTRQSKFLSLVLRHNPEAGNLTLDHAGWARVSDIIRALRTQFGQFNRDDLQVLVDTNEKKRFSFNEHGDKIRANQGHSLKVDLGLEPADPPAILFHGTKTHNLDGIFKDGLTPGSRQHVHLSPDIDTAAKVALRRAGRSIILRIRAGEMTDHIFYRSANGVWLTDHVPPQFITLDAAELALGDQ